MSSAAPAGRTLPALASLTAPVRALLTVAGDELRKDGGNEAAQVFVLPPPEEPKAGSESRNPVGVEQQTLSGERPCNLLPTSHTVPRC